MDDVLYLQEIAVTPYVGVWIETKLVHPDRMCVQVTPYVGVWIETYSPVFARASICVTPYVGVWIETTTRQGCRPEC